MSTIAVKGSNDTAGSDVVLCFRPGTSGYNPTWFALANTGIFWDPVAGNDNASGASGFPVQTFAEITRRFGSDAPQPAAGQNIIINQLSAQTLNVDNVFLFPRLSSGGYAALIGTLTIFAAAAPAGVVTVKNKAAGTDLTVATMPGGTTAGMYVFNSTNGSYAFVKSMSGSTATMTQPIAAAGVTTIGLAALIEGVDWVTGDTITIYNIPPLCNLKSWRPNGGDVVGSAACVGWVQWIQIADASGAGTAEHPMVCDCAELVFSGCYIASRLHSSCLNGRGSGALVYGCMCAQAVLALVGEFTVFAGTILGTLGTNSTALVVSGDCIIVGATSVGSVGGLGGVAVVTAHFVGNITVHANCVFAMSGTSTFWGAAGISLFPGATYWNNVNTFVSAMLITGTISFQSSTTGSTYNAGTGLWTGGIALTPANFDLHNGLTDPTSRAGYCQAA